MSYKILRPQIADLLDNDTKLQVVKSFPTFRFNGFPAAYIIPSENSGDYETTTENIRVYAFTVRMFYETKDSGVETALKALEELVDDVLDTFDQEDLKGSANRTIGVSLPSAYTYINIWAHPTSFGEVEGENLLMAELTVRVRISIDIS